MERIKEILKKLWIIISKEEMKILPGNLAFFIVLSAIPVITLLGVIASWFSVSVSTISQFMIQTFPVEVSDLLVPFITGNGFDINIFLFMIIGFCLASNGTHSIIIASDTVYGIEPDELLKRRIKSIFLAIILVNLIMFILIVLAFGNTILLNLVRIDALKSFSHEIYNMFNLFKWPVAFIFIFFAIKLLYTIAPDKKILSKYMNRGAAFTTLCWIVVTAVYSYYVHNFANYDIFYGGLSNIVVLMMWVYILSYILVVGIAINANTYKIATEQEKSVNHK